MTEHVLHLLASNSRIVPTRICGLLAQRNVCVTAVQMTMSPDSQHWCIQVTLALDHADDVELVINRLSRLIDVVTVVEADAFRMN